MSCTVYTRGGHAFSVVEHPPFLNAESAEHGPWLMFTDPTTERRIEIRAADIVAVRLPKKEQT